MRVNVSFHRLAERELNEAALYYEEESKGLGAAFLDAVQRTLDFISDYPGAAQPVTELVRRKLIPRFPYAVLFRLRGNEIRVLAVAHQMRRPLYWRRRS